MPGRGNGDADHHKDRDRCEYHPFVADLLRHMERFHRVAERAVGRDEKEREIQHIRQVDQGGRKVLPLHAGRIRHDAEDGGDERQDHRPAEENNILQRYLKLPCIEVQEQKKHWQRGKAEIHIPLAEESPDSIHVLHLLSKKSLQGGTYEGVISRLYKTCILYLL